MKSVPTTVGVVYNKKYFKSKIIFYFFILSTIFSFTALAQDELLDEDTLPIFMIQMKFGVGSNLSGSDATPTSLAIQEKWEKQDLMGKTKQQAMELLFEDVKSFVKDEETLKKIWDFWNGARKPDPTPSPTNPAETTDKIDFGAPPLSEGDMNKVMDWIAVRTSALRLPFCWKQSYGRGAGEPLSNKCAPGLEKDGLLCYNQCKANFNGVGPVCWADCPRTFTNIGAFCQKPGSYGRGAGYAAWNEDDCKKDNKQGCEKSGAIWYPKCKKGFHAVGCCVCSPDCPKGWDDTGTGCTKPTYGRGGGEPLACKAGLDRDGLLCYPQCDKGMNGVGPVCWQRCPSQQSWDCGAACATNQKECAFAVLKMVTAPIMAAVNIATLGSAAAATAPAKAAKIGESVSKMKKAYNSVKAALSAAKGDVTKLLGGEEKVNKIKETAKIGGNIYKVATVTGSQIHLFSKEFADNFEEMTSKEIAAEIDSRFGPEAAYEIKRQWGIYHLGLMLEADGFKTGKNLLTLVSIADPTGLVSVAEAFMHPVCKKDAPFPEVVALYNR